MGGHGALMIALRNPGRYQSVSAFSPIVAPSQVPWEKMHCLLIWVMIGNTGSSTTRLS